MLPETGDQVPKASQGAGQRKPSRKRSTKSKDRSQATVSSLRSNK